MTELLTAAQMRALEQAAIARGAVTGLDLMERAGAGVVAAIREEWPVLQAGALHAVVLCGPGNNGGDGFVVARLLAESGATVWTFLYGDPERLPPDARVSHDRWAALGPVRQVTDLAGIAPQMDALLTGAAARGRPLLVVDALFGIGLTRPVPRFDLFGGELELWYLDDNLHVVAVDVPSGLCADSGRVLATGPGNATPLVADLTVTFHTAKPGHYLAEGPAMCGKLRIVDLGLPHTVPLSRARLQLTGDGGLWPGSVRKRQGHKFDYGHALVLSGGTGRGGAARLAARGALRVGAGLVTLACPPAALTENAARLDAVMLRPVADAAALEQTLADPRITALCLGPGLGLDARAAALIAAALAAGRPTLLDADALTLVARDPAFAAALHPGCVLTPHAGEFARLFPDLAADLAQPATRGPGVSKVDATRAAAARAGCVVLLKGADTVIAAPDGTAAINAAAYDRAAPWLATAGSGDVLAGLIAGLLARGFPPFRAAGIGAFLHVDCARSFGPGLIAEDLPDMIPQVLRGYGA